MTFDLHDIRVRHPGSPRGISSGDALCGVSMHIDAGEQIAVIGPSGAGKTTLLHLLALARRPEAGIVTISGIDPWQLSNGRRHRLRASLFLAPQTPPLPPRQRVVTAVLAARLPHWNFLQALRSLVKPVETSLAYDALTRFHLQDKLYVRVDRLSGGERQRVGMARLIASSARMFLVDEPLSALDPALARQTIEVLQEEARQRHATLVCSLHQVEEARRFFPRLVGLRNGRVVFDEPRERVTDAMIDALYSQEEAVSPVIVEDDALHAAPAVPRCF